MVKVSFCTCQQYDPVEPDNDLNDQCKCGHSLDDHIQQILAECNARSDPTEMGLFP